MKIPKRILFVGVVFCLGGFLAVWDVITNLIDLSIHINFGLFLLPVGIGLLRGELHSRWWARFWIILGYIFCTVTAGIILFASAVTEVTLFGNKIEGSAAIPYLLCCVIFFIIFLFSLHKILYSKHASDFFQEKSKLRNFEKM